ncbi:hypothetical protein ABEV34_01370 [Methylorubrum rhodesianum]|uniref:hypothetical protein n=1 Tax=Methylorubrum TaxID=2282523 RepID=UPI0018E2FD2A|nr:hypothetical protein [Methylorubrum sp. DB1722]
MNIVRALSNYRVSLLEDEVLFEILCLLYKDGAKSEASLGDDIGLPQHRVKKSVRELHNANLIIFTSKNCIRVTSLAEKALAHLDVDSVVVPFMIDDVVPLESSRFRTFARWALTVDSGHAGATTQSLRNLRTFLSHRTDATHFDRTSMALNCVVQSASNLQEVLQSEDTSKSLFLFFAGHGISEDGLAAENDWDYFQTSYKSALKINNSVNNIFLSACDASARFDQEDVRHLGDHLSFRIFDWLLTPRRDFVLESCSKRMVGDRAGVVWKIIWDRLHDTLNDETTDLRELESMTLSSATDLARLINHKLKLKESDYSSLPPQIALSEHEHLPRAQKSIRYIPTEDTSRGMHSSNRDIDNE